ncbi:MAG: O-methyltransferase [Gaiellaceae bacterium]
MAREPAQEPWIAVDDYVEGLLLAPDPVLEAAEAACATAGLPPISVSPIQGKLLHLLARAVRARTILEVGTLGAYSTIWLARALLPGGGLITLELEPRHAEVALANLARADLAERVELRVGNALETLAQLVAESRGPFDLIFIDADKQGYAEYLRWALDLSRPGTLIVADNVVRDGDVSDAASGDPRVQGVRRFHEALAAEPRLSATTIQTVGRKGYDGFTLVLVTGES